jgi:hypothetical protein
MAPNGQSMCMHYLSGSVDRVDVYFNGELVNYKKLLSTIAGVLSRT